MSYTIAGDLHISQKDSMATERKRWRAVALPRDRRGRRVVIRDGQDVFRVNGRSFPTPTSELIGQKLVRRSAWCMHSGAQKRQGQVMNGVLFRTTTISHRPREQCAKEADASAGLQLERICV